MNKNKIKKEIFNHKIEEQVKFHEVDLLGVCNNAVYFNYFEDARLRYIQDLKKRYNLKELLEGDSFFIMVHNHCDYLQSAKLDDELIIHTRINFLKNTSFGFEHLVENKTTKNFSAVGGGIVVHINRVSKEKLALHDEFYNAVTLFEKEVDILKNKV